MKWKKLGLIYRPRAHHPKLLSHAANPLPILLKDDVYRIFFNGRDYHNRSSVGAVDVDIIKRTVLSSYKKPFLKNGPAGSFYENGVSIGNCYEANKKKFIVFMGWQNPCAKHWRGEIGRVVVNDDLSLLLDNEKPFLGIDEKDPISLSYPWVMPKDPAGYHMWYGSTISWDVGNGEMLHVLKYASSLDGFHWCRHGVAVPFVVGVAQAFSHPTVIGNEQEGYHMWFSYRSGAGERYRIGYAKSDDAVEWSLNLERAGIEVSSNGWDSEMIEYPFVFDHKCQRYMLYNGNGYGKTGFGLAVLDQD